MAAKPTRILVPVNDSVTLRNTVAYAVREVVAAAEEGVPDPTLHFVYLATWRDDDPGTTSRRSAAEELLEQISVWTDYDLDDADAEGIPVETVLLGGDDYLFSPSDYAEILESYAEQHDLDHVIVDPEYAVVGNAALLQPLEFELSKDGFDVTEAPVERPARRVRLVREVTASRYAALFGISFVFYTVLAGSVNGFDIVTGLVSATVVATTLSSVSFDHDPTLSETPLRLARGILFIPVLFYEILKSNVVVARVILDPRISIEPRMTRVQSLVGAGLPVTTLSNSITLTPGTLTVRARNRDLYVHTLIPWAREGLFDGGLERWTRFVFYGRSAAQIPSPRERGDVEILQGLETPEEIAAAEAEADANQSERGDA